MKFLVPSFLAIALIASQFHENRAQDFNLSCVAGLEVFRGPPGPPGSKGEKGDSCDQSLCVSRREFEELKQVLLKLQRNSFRQAEQIVAILSRNKPTIALGPNATMTTPVPTISTTTANSRSIRNCDDVYNSGIQSDGVYSIFTGSQFVEVYCEFQRNGGNWMIFQQRIDGSVDFYLNWTSYVNGFGNKSGEFWLGLQALHEITSSASYRLRVDLEDWEGITAYAEYSSFSIENSTYSYRLNVSGYSGTAGDSLTFQDTRGFSTKDRDVDSWHSSSCAVRYQGAWWYRSCQLSNLNGRYRNVGPGDGTGVGWNSWKTGYSMRHASMKLRPN